MLNVNFHEEQSHCGEIAYRWNLNNVCNLSCCFCTFYVQQKTNECTNDVTLTMLLEVQFICINNMRIKDVSLKHLSCPMLIKWLHFICSCSEDVRETFSISDFNIFESNASCLDIRVSWLIVTSIQQQLKSVCETSNIRLRDK